jgi:hypothetical protein
MGITCRKNSGSSKNRWRIQLKIKWLGLEEEIWEPFDSITVDVQALVQQYLENAHLDKAWKKEYSTMTAF